MPSRIRKMPVFASWKAIEYELPRNELRNEELARDFPDWSVEKIYDKTATGCRHIALADECASDLALRGLG
jgi:3-oxoacyl-[acyl-carrier-protein] synthase-3